MISDICFLVVQYEVATSVSILLWPNFVFGVLLEPRDADLGSLLGVSFGSWVGRLPAAAERHKNRTPVERPPRLCSLSVVIYVFLCIPNRKNTRESRRTASTDGGSLLGKTGLALERGAIFEGFFVVFFAPGYRTASVGVLGVGGMGRAGMTWGRALFNLHVPFFIFQTS